MSRADRPAPGLPLHQVAHLFRAPPFMGSWRVGWVEGGKTLNLDPVSGCGKTEVQFL